MIEYQLQESVFVFGNMFVTCKIELPRILGSKDL